MAKPKKPSPKSATKPSAKVARVLVGKPAKASAFKSTPAVKVVTVEKEIAAAKPADGKAGTKAAKPPFAGVQASLTVKKGKAPAKEYGGRLEIPAPDFQEWWDNLKAYAYKSPAALVVGIIAIWMALVLLVD